MFTFWFIMNVLCINKFVVLYLFVMKVVIKISYKTYILRAHMALYNIVSRKICSLFSHHIFRMRIFIK